MQSLKGLILLCLVAVAAGGPVVLTDSNFDDLVYNSGKNTFVKFFAPWCGHCKAIKPAWDELGTEYESSSSVIIADADCTVESSLCGKHGVQGYPTIKYFTAGDKEGKSYSGGRDKDSLKKFIKDTLEVKCDIKTKEGCSDKEIKFIDSFNAKSSEDRQAQISRLDKMKGDKMKPELKEWVIQRLQILKAMEA